MTWPLSLCSTWVYPRVGGGTPIGLLLVAIAAGLSPRGRGNLCRERFQ